MTDPSLGFEIVGVLVLIAVVVALLWPRRARRPRSPDTLDLSDFAHRKAANDCIGLHAQIAEAKRRKRSTRHLRVQLHEAEQRRDDLAKVRGAHTRHRPF